MYEQALFSCGSRFFAVYDGVLRPAHITVRDLHVGEPALHLEATPRPRPNSLTVEDAMMNIDVLDQKVGAVLPKDAEARADTLAKAEVGCHEVARAARSSRRVNGLEQMHLITGVRVGNDSKP